MSVNNVRAFLVYMYINNIYKIEVAPDTDLGKKNEHVLYYY